MVFVYCFFPLAIIKLRWIHLLIARLFPFLYCICDMHIAYRIALIIKDHQLTSYNFETHSAWNTLLEHRHHHHIYCDWVSIVNLFLISIFLQSLCGCPMNFFSFFCYNYLFYHNFYVCSVFVLHCTFSK